MAEQVSSTEGAGAAAVRRGQARAGLSALQLAGPQESARRVAIGLRGVKSEENRRPDHRMTAPRKVRKRHCEEERKSVGQFRLHCMPKTASDRIPIFSAGQTPSPNFSPRLSKL